MELEEMKPLLRGDVNELIERIRHDVAEYMDKKGTTALVYKGTLSFTRSDCGVDDPDFLVTNGAGGLAFQGSTSGTDWFLTEAWPLGDLYAVADWADSIGNCSAIYGLLLNTICAIDTELFLRKGLSEPYHPGKGLDICEDTALCAIDSDGEYYGRTELLRLAIRLHGEAPHERHARLVRTPVVEGVQQFDSAVKYADSPTIFWDRKAGTFGFTFYKGEWLLEYLRAL